MSESEYIAVLWRVIYGLCFVVVALTGIVWHHILEDRKTRVELQRCKDKLGLNGVER